MEDMSTNEVSRSIDIVLFHIFYNNSTEKKS